MRQPEFDLLDYPVELCQSVCERTLHTGVIARKQLLFLNNGDGSGAWGDLLTVFGTCRLNNVDPYRYLVWLMDNIAVRTSARAETTLNPDMYHMPSVKKLKDSRSRTVRTPGLYDKDNVCFGDDLDLTGLAPWYYARLLSSGDKQERAAA